MKKRTNTLNLILFLIGIFWINGCNLEAAGPSTWIDQPLDGSILPIQPIQIQAHASAEGGIYQMEFLTDEVQIALVDLGGARLEDATIQWTPANPGKHVIEVRAASSDGMMGQVSQVEIVILEAGAEPPAQPVNTPESVEFSPSPTGQKPLETPLLLTATFIPPTSTTSAPPTAAKTPIATIPPPDNTPPQISSAFVLPNSILTESGGCSSYVRTVSVQVVTTDNVGVFRVSASWDIGGTEFGEIVLSAQGGNAYQGTIGPVHTVGTMVVYVSVLDGAFNITSTDAFFINVQNCIE